MLALAGATPARQGNGHARVSHVGRGHGLNATSAVLVAALRVAASVAPPARVTAAPSARPPLIATLANAPWPHELLISAAELLLWAVELRTKAVES